LDAHSSTKMVCSVALGVVFLGAWFQPNPGSKIATRLETVSFPTEEVDKRLARG
jgi:hypothetical protein